VAVSTASEGGSSASTVARDTGADQARGAVSGGFRAPRGHYLPIAEHGLIGDLHTVALVGTDGTIDWYCCPRFDSPSPEPMPTRAITSVDGGVAWSQSRLRLVHSDQHARDRHSRSTP